MITRFITLASCLLLFNACSGYQLGSAKPEQLASVSKICVPLAKNDTLQQRVATLTTNTIIDEITRDGTYQITRSSDCDATLNTTIKTIEFKEFRASRLDTLRAEELEVKITVDWQLVDASGKVLASDSHVGESTFFAASNQQLSRTNALPDASENVAEQIVSSLANGF